MKVLKNIGIVLLAILLNGCSGSSDNVTQTKNLSDEQNQLLNDGWTLEIPKESDITKELGTSPVYGTRDNYLDITMGEGYSVVVKIIDKETDDCIRTVFISENTSETVHDIPQGVYYLKIAYGKDWMTFDDGNKKLGKFTSSVYYEKSQDVFDYKNINSDELVNYTVDLNSLDSDLNKKFHTVPIEEEEFNK